MSQLSVKNISVVYLSLCSVSPAAASDEKRFTLRQKKKQFEAGTKSIRSFLRVNLFSFFALFPFFTNYKVYIFVTYRLQSKKSSAKTVFHPSRLFLSSFLFNSYFYFSSWSLNKKKTRGLNLGIESINWNDYFRRILSKVERNKRDSFSWTNLCKSFDKLKKHEKVQKKLKKSSAAFTSTKFIPLKCLWSFINYQGLAFVGFPPPFGVLREFSSW